MIDGLDMNERQFPLGLVCRAAPADPRVVQNWFARGAVSLGERVSERKRVLSAWEAVELAITTRLTQLLQQSNLESAVRWANTIVASLKNVRPLAEAESLSDWHAFAFGPRALVAMIFVGDGFTIDGQVNVVAHDIILKAEADLLANGKVPAPMLRLWVGAAAYSTVDRLLAAKAEAAAA